MAVLRIYVEKKPSFAVEAGGILHDITTVLGIKELKTVRILNRYDVEGITQEDFASAKSTIFSEPQVDVTYDTFVPKEGELVFAVEYLPGQFDQRADSCAQCISLSTQKDRPLVRTARVFVLTGNLSKEQFAAIQSYLINPVESREASLEKPATLKMQYDVPSDVKILDGFISLNRDELCSFIDDYGLAMDIDDITFLQGYFKDEEKRDPTITEIRMIDTYWSDHCRHTTFQTNIDKVEIATDYIADQYASYLKLRETLYAGKNKPVTLMDLATIAAKALKAKGKLPDLDQSEEINACSVKIKVDVDGEEQDWLLMFKNETHNHPTEIEPFGGAATCLGGAIRDPLSGRSYVYQAMRVTGAGDPLVPIEQTLPGKLPQRKLVTTAASGYSSYGNQIGLATGQVNELYHPGYVAKRMEIGAVIGAAKAEDVVRERPIPSDVVILLGGGTGRDGCGGATGSSKSHTASSLESCGAEVQKGNAPEERKIQRLFRNGEVTRLIKRCNDFGAGGVSVAIGELADGLFIDLDKVPKKYDGLDGTELAISESQERMAVVVAKENVDKFISAASGENLLAVAVATVTQSPRLVMTWKGKTIVDLSRAFIDSNGAAKHTSVELLPVVPYAAEKSTLPLKEQLTKLMGDLNICCQKGLSERFDASIGAGTVLMPFGGRHQLTPTQAMAAKIPVLKGNTTTCSMMSWGFNPFISEKSPYHGAMMAVIESVSKLIASGGSYHTCWLTFQEYFEKIKNDPKKWGKPFAALLGALQAQMELEIAAIGGKDSMSGSFEELHVPPTLVSFAVSVAGTYNVISPEFKGGDNNVYLLTPTYDANGLPQWDSVRHVFDTMESLIAGGKIRSAWAIGQGGVAAAICQMAFGNSVGFRFNSRPSDEVLFQPCYGGFVFEAAGCDCPDAVLLGATTDKYVLSIDGEEIPLCDLQKVWEQKLMPVYPFVIPTPKVAVPTYSIDAPAALFHVAKTPKPKVLIPVFPGTNCEYDTARAFEREGAEAQILVLRNLTSTQVEESVSAMEKAIMESQIIALPGGFSGGDEPEGSAKFITAFFRNPRITQAVHQLLKDRDGLMCGICNGFQALVKLGLVPYGEICNTDETYPTLTFNDIGRHQSQLVRTRISCNKSPWLMHTQIGDVFTVPISHGEGKFVASEELIAKLAANGQIASQYVDLSGQATMDIRHNPNGSVHAIEGITSPDGRVFGKMAHSERWGGHLYVNVDGRKRQPMFQGAVDYFTK